MPIRPEHRHYYTGKKWKKARERVLRRANNSCEQCGVLNGQMYMRFRKGVNHEARVVLTVAHLDHNPPNRRMSNLKALCQRCHLKYDEKHHAETRRINAAKKQGLQPLPF